MALFKIVAVDFDGTRTSGGSVVPMVCGLRKLELQCGPK
jgi:hypothetical protein